MIRAESRQTGRRTQRDHVHLDMDHLDMDHLDMDHLLLLLLLWSSGLQAEGGLTSTESVRLVGGGSRCAGTLEVKHNGEWRPVDNYLFGWTLKTSAAACRELDCGSAVSVVREESSDRSVWRIRSDCVESGSGLRECAEPGSSSFILDLTCSDSVRLVDGDQSVLRQTGGED
ncbi:CD5 antigen-like [Etheostoma spectabile]|uniref:CD5 antigen-like n=1 Tax=Etheostoma spectabile TaxID=54343 RepID=UPI0013AFE486|nr:CD5 antigen-like [Etheostoma spectabile]